MVPDFDKDGKLPPGIHVATWAEVVARFGSNKRRRGLLKGLAAALEVLRAAGCRTVYLDGSFVTSKATPGDYDVAWEPVDVDIAMLLRLDAVFGDFADERAAQKAKYGGEFFPSSVNEALTARTFLEFFQTDKETGAAKGSGLLVQWSILRHRLQSRHGLRSVIHFGQASPSTQRPWRLP